MCQASKCNPRLGKKPSRGNDRRTAATAAVVTETVLTVFLIFLTDIVLAVLIFLTEIVLTVLIFLRR